MVIYIYIRIYIYIYIYIIYTPTVMVNQYITNYNYIKYYQYMTIFFYQLPYGNIYLQYKSHLSNGFQWNPVNQGLRPQHYEATWRSVIVTIGICLHIYIYIYIYIYICIIYIICIYVCVYIYNWYSRVWYSIVQCSWFVWKQILKTNPLHR